MYLGVVLWKEDRQPTQNELIQCLEDEGFDVMQWSDPPGAIYEPHSHSHDESIWLYQGIIEFTIDGQTYPLAPGDRLFLPKDTVHAARVPDEHSADYLIGQK